MSVSIGDFVKIKRKKKTGEINYTEENSIKKVEVVGKYKNFIVVQHKEGYKECFKENELVDGIIIKD